MSVSQKSNLPPELRPFRLLTPRQVEELTGKKQQTLANERHRRVGIRYLKFGGSVRYALEDVLAFINAHRIELGA